MTEEVESHMLGGGERVLGGRVALPPIAWLVQGEGGSMFSHTLGRRTLKCYLMLVGEHVDRVGFLRRA